MDKVSPIKSTVPPHEFALIEVIGAVKNVKLNRWEGGTNTTIGYVVDNTDAKFKPAYKVITVNDAGELVPTDFVIDSTKAGELLLKHKTPETVTLEDGTTKTYEFSIIGMLFPAPSKQLPGKSYYRCTQKHKDTGDVLRQFRMFPNDGKFAANPGLGIAARTGT